MLPLPFRLAAFLLFASAASAQTIDVRFEAGRLDDSPLFPPSATTFVAGSLLRDGPPPGVATRAVLDSVRHAAIALEGTPDTLLVVVGVEAGERAAFVGTRTAGLVPIDLLATADLFSPTGSKLAGVARLPLGDAADIAVEVAPYVAQGYVWYRQLDFRRGTLDIDGTPRAVALVRAPGAARFETGPLLNVLVDLNGDGTFAQTGLGTSEAQAADRPFRIGDAAFRLLSVTADGSAATFERVDDDAEALAVGFRMPDLALVRRDGTPMRLSDLGGRIVVLNSWADWCRPCYQEMPSLSTVVAAHADDPRIAFVAIANNTRAELEAALVGRTFDYEQTVAGEGSVHLLGRGYPRHIVVGADGRVKFDMLGGSPDIHKVIEAVLAPLVAALPPAE